MLYTERQKAAALEVIKFSADKATGFEDMRRILVFAQNAVESAGMIAKNRLSVQQVAAIVDEKKDNESLWLGLFHENTEAIR